MRQRSSSSTSRKITVEPHVWQEIIKRLPAMEHIIVPNSKHILKPQLELYVNNEYKYYSYLGIRLEVKTKKTCFFTEHLDEKQDYIWRMGEDRLINDENVCLVDEQKFIEYIVANEGNNIVNSFTWLCKRVPWEMAVKTLSSTAKLGSDFFYEFEYDWSIDALYQKENFASDHVFSENQTLFAFQGGIKREKNSYYANSLVHLICHIITYVGGRLNPQVVNGSPAPAREIQYLSSLFRQYLHLMQTAYVYGIYRKKDEEFYSSTRYAQLSSTISADILKHVDSMYTKNYWKDKEVAERESAEKSFFQITTIINQHWWEKTKVA